MCDTAVAKVRLGSMWLLRRRQTYGAAWAMTVLYVTNSRVSVPSHDHIVSIGD
jgi:hypothetical protein